MKEKEETKEKPRCSKCGSTMVYLRLKTKEHAEELMFEMEKRK